MKTRMAAIVALALLVAAAPLAAFAQGDLKLETYESPDGLFTISYPAGWFSYTDEEAPFPMVFFVNTEDALARIEAGEDIISGDAAVMAFVLPSEFLAFFGVTLAEDATPAEVAEAVAIAMFGPEPAADGSVDESEQVTFSEFEEVELSEDRLGGYATATASEQEASIVIFSPGERLMAIVYSATAAGELSDEYIELSKVAAASLTYDGTAEDLMLAIMGGAVGQAPEETTADEYDGEALVAERCTVCHAADRINAASKDEAGWAATVDRMIGYGAQLNSAEREAVIAYLISK